MPSAPRRKQLAHNAVQYTKTMLHFEEAETLYQSPPTLNIHENKINRILILCPEVLQIPRQIIQQRILRLIRPYFWWLSQKIWTASLTKVAPPSRICS